MKMMDSAVKMQPPKDAIVDQTNDKAAMPFHKRIIMLPARSGTGITSIIS
jgi:hypothetical protein